MVSLRFAQLFLRKVEKKSKKVLVVMKKALNLQQKSIKLRDKKQLNNINN